MATGTQLANVAYVEFDFAGDIYDHPAPKVDPDVEPAEPAPWINTIDAGEPQSNVLPLPATTTQSTFEIRWSGEDDAGGSGIGSYDVYVSTDGGPFQILVDDATDVSTSFTGEVGHSYAFYSRARDNVGYVENAPDSPDAQIMVLAAPDETPPVSAVSPLPVETSTEVFLVQWSGEDEQGGTGLADYSIFVSENGGPFEVWLENTTFTSDQFVGKPGKQYAFYSVSRDNAGNVEVAPALPDAETLVLGNDPPVLSVPEVQSTPEDTPLPISGVSVSDIDSDDLTVTIVASGGQLQLAATPGVTIIGNNSASVEVAGQQDALNTVLSSLVFTPPIDASGQFTLTVTATDGELDDSQPVSITVTPVNDPPTLSLPKAQTTDENRPLTFSSATLNPISIADVDSTTLDVTLSVDNGVLTMGDQNGLSFSEGTGINDTTVTFCGALADINSALSGLKFRPTTHFHGSATLAIELMDDALPPVADAIPITVNPVNDPPVLSVPEAQSTPEDTPLSISGISVSDVESDDLTVTIGASGGQLQLAATPGVTIIGNNSASLEAVGKQEYVNSALASVVFTPPAGTSGQFTLTVSASDGKLDDSQTVLINVTPVNYRPQIKELVSSAPLSDRASPGEQVTIAALLNYTGEANTAQIDWGDGTSTDGQIDPDIGAVSGSHSYATGGIFTIKLTVTNGSGQSTTASSTAYVIGVGLTDDGELQIVGTSENDRVKINKRGRGQLKVRADFLPSRPRYRTFNLTDVKRIVAYLSEGSDRLRIARNVNIPAIIHGEEGNDKLWGGKGNDILDGGDGHDRLRGRRGSDILLGGEGADKLSGHSGHDILIGGFGYDKLYGGRHNDLLIGGHTGYDNDYDALERVFAEWGSGEAYSARVSMLHSGDNPRLDGVFLEAGVTVFDDDTRDRLRGNSGRDWLFAELSGSHEDDRLKYKKSKSEWASC